MRIKNYFLVILVVGLFLSSTVARTHAQVVNSGNQTIQTSQLIAQLLIQLQDLREQLANVIKYQPGKPLNTITEIIGPKNITAGEYNSWNFVTKNSDPDNYSSLMINWGDGVTSVSGSGYTYNTPGTYTITATNHDGNGEPSTLTHEVTVGATKGNGTLTPWGNKLVSNTSLIPENKFRAYFFNKKDFKTEVAPTIVDQPVFSYPNDSFGSSYSFDEHTLAAYWVGSFSYKKDTDVYFDFSNPQWDTARFIVDGKTIIETNREKDATNIPTLTLKKGKHIIEVEYQVNWHAGYFRANIGTTPVIYTNIASAKDAARKIAGVSAVTIPISEYTSADTETGVTVVAIPNTTAPKILELNSYEPTLWDVTGASARGVKAIILSSFAGAADVIHSGNIPIFRTHDYRE